MPIRLATARDAEKIAHIHVSAWRSAYTDFMPSSFLNSLSVEERAVTWHKALSTPSPGVTAVAEKGHNSLTAFCVYGPSRDEDRKNSNVGELVALNVLPSEWRRGYGRELCHSVLAHAQTAGWTELTLWVLKDNAPARAFYESFGFVPDGVEKHDAKLTGFDLHEVRYAKAITRGHG